MPSMTEAMSNLTHTIVLQRRNRGEAAALRHKVTKDRSIVVASLLHDARTSHAAATRDYRATALAIKTKRPKDVAALLAVYRRALLARHRHRLELAAVQHRQLAAFMTGLTASVGSLRSRFRTDLERQRSAQRSRLAAFMTDLTGSVDTLRTGFRADLESERVALKAAARHVHQRLDEVRRDLQGARAAWRGHKPAAPARPAGERSPRPEPSRPTETAGEAARSTTKETEPAPRVAAPMPKPAAMGGPSKEAPPHEARSHAAPQARGQSGSPAPGEGRGSS